MNDDRDYENGQKPDEEGRVHGRNISHDLADASHIERGSDRDRGYIYHADGTVERITGYPEMYPTPSLSSRTRPQSATYRYPRPSQRRIPPPTCGQVRSIPPWVSSSELRVLQHFPNAKSIGLGNVLDQLQALYEGIGAAKRRLERGVSDAFEYMTLIQKWNGTIERLEKEFSVSIETVIFWKKITRKSTRIGRPITLTKKKHKQKKPKRKTSNNKTTI